VIGLILRSLWIRDVMWFEEAEEAVYIVSADYSIYQLGESIREACGRKGLRSGTGDYYIPTPFDFPEKAMSVLHKRSDSEDIEKYILPLLGMEG
jgi:hypothetical protein